MKKKLKCVLLVDDDSDCNFYHQRLLQKMDCTDKVEVAGDGFEAINYLKTSVDGKFPTPDIIFLDINMPRMNGWEFLEEYSLLPEEQKARMVLVMLTTSLNPDDKERGINCKDVSGFQNKYLDRDNLQKIINENFPDYA